MEPSKKKLLIGIIAVLILVAIPIIIYSKNKVDKTGDLELKAEKANVEFNKLNNLAELAIVQDNLAAAELKKLAAQSSRNSSNKEYNNEIDRLKEKVKQTSQIAKNAKENANKSNNRREVVEKRLAAAKRNARANANAQAKAQANAQAKANANAQIAANANAQAKANANAQIAANANAQIAANANAQAKANANAQIAANANAQAKANANAQIAANAQKPYTSLGCYVDKEDRALRTTYQDITTILGCRQKAHSLGAKVFGVQDGGQCWIDSDVERDYAQYGKTTCVPIEGAAAGTGGPWINHMYQVN